MKVVDIRNLLKDVEGFDWDRGNKDKNWKKHKVIAKESEEVFAKKPRFIAEDKKHSTVEKRYMLWGITKKKRKLIVVFTIRNEKIRIISARDMNKKERRFYEEKT